MTSNSHITANNSIHTGSVGEDEVDFARPTIGVEKFGETPNSFLPPASHYKKTDDYVNRAMKEVGNLPFAPVGDQLQQKRKAYNFNAESSEENAVDMKKQRPDAAPKARMNECSVDGSDHMVVITGPGCTINLTTPSPTKPSQGSDSTDSGDRNEPDSGHLPPSSNQSSARVPSQSCVSNSNASKGPSLKKIFRYVSERIPHEWKNVARELPITDDNLIEAEIHQIEERYRGNLKEQAYNGLILWENSCAEECTKERLIEALRNCRLNYVVRELSKQTWMKT